MRAAFDQTFRSGAREFARFAVKTDGCEFDRQVGEGLRNPLWEAGNGPQGARHNLLPGGSLTDAATLIEGEPKVEVTKVQ